MVNVTVGIDLAKKVFSVHGARVRFENEVKRVCKVGCNDLLR